MTDVTTQTIPLAKGRKGTLEEFHPTQTEETLARTILGISLSGR